MRQGHPFAWAPIVVLLLNVVLYGINVGVNGSFNLPADVKTWLLLVEPVAFYAVGYLINALQSGDWNFPSPIPGIGQPAERRPPPPPPPSPVARTAPVNPPRR